MNVENEGRSRSRRRGNRAKEATLASKRDVNYRQLRNPFPQMDVFSTDQAEDMHQSALRILEDMGMRVLLPEARMIFVNAGARVEDEMVFI
ncbi:MAG: trimethylamine methyltransferase family protein, partial [Arenibacterium sp.]